jgi:hypothetical protein
VAFSSAASTGRFGAAVTQYPRRDFSIWAGIATVAALAAHTYVTQAGFAQELIVQASFDLQALQLIDWRRNSTSWRVECISDYDPYWEAREIADRVESGAQVYVGCLHVRIVGK